MKDTILILEDNLLRIKGFEAMVVGLGMRVKCWKNAWEMVGELPVWLPNAALISLDYDLEGEESLAESPGTGLDVVHFLSMHSPVCPVILHSGSPDHREIMREVLSLSGWDARAIPSEDSRRVVVSWFRMAAEILRQSSGLDGAGGSPPRAFH